MKTQNDTVNCGTHLIPKRTKYCMRKEGEKKLSYTTWPNCDQSG